MTTLGKSITGGIIILVLVSGGYYFTRATKDAGMSNAVETTKNDQKMVQPTEPVNGAIPTKEAGKKIAFSEFIKQGGSYSCTVNQTINGETSKGTMYIDGAKVRSEVTMNIKGQSMTMNFLVLDDYTYTWNSMMPTMGYKIKINKDAGASAGTGAVKASAAWNADQIGDYSCDTWSVDESKFTLPATVKFSVMGS